MKKRFNYGSGIIKLSENSNLSEIEILRVLTIQDRGLKITKKMLNDFVKNFDADVYGQGRNIPVNLGHYREGEAAGWMKELFIKGNKLFANIEWTPLGIEKITNKLYKFISAEFEFKVPHHKTGELIENVLIGAALTNIPALKKQKPVALNEDLNKIINKNNMFKLLLNELKKRAFLSEEDKTLFKVMLSELPAEEKAEHADDIKNVEDKPSTDEEGDEKDEEKEGGKKEDGKEGDEAKEEIGKEKTEGGAESQELNEIIIVQNKRIGMLEEEAGKTKLSEDFNETLMLSSTNSKGFSKNDRSQVVGFMAKLSESGKKEFKTILGKYKQVDLSERGSTKTDIVGGSDVKSNDLEEAAKVAKEKGITKSEALSEMYSARNRNV